MFWKLWPQGRPAHLCCSPRPLALAVQLGNVDLLDAGVPNELPEHPAVPAPDNENPLRAARQRRASPTPGVAW